MTRRGAGLGLTLTVGLAGLLLTLVDVVPRYVPHTWIQRDGRFYTNVNVTLVEGLSLDQGEFAASWYEGKLGWNRNLNADWSNVALGRGGVHLPKHPVLLPILSTPLFWAFGLPGTLAFNVLLFGLLVGVSFAVARRYATTPAAAAAALAAILGSGLRLYTYDYHVDVLNLLLFVAAFELLHQRRGALAGALLGLTVALKPTGLMWLPSLAILLLGRRDRRTLLYGLAGGTAVLLAFGVVNTWLFGRPWWAGYNRTLVVVNGVPQVTANIDAFDVPWREGIRTLWEGPWGIRHRLPLFGLSALGLVALARRRPAYVVAAVLGTALSIVVFARYRWFGDRFLWPSAALLLPALAAAFDLGGRWLGPRRRPLLVAALAAMALAGLHGLVGPGATERLADGGRALGLRVLEAGVLAAATALAAMRLAGRARTPAPPRALALQRPPPAGAPRRPVVPWGGGAGAWGAVAAVGLLLLPGVLDRLLGGGTAVYVALGVVLLAAARWWLAAPVVLALLALGWGADQGPVPLHALAALATVAPALLGSVGGALADLWRASRWPERGAVAAAALLLLGAIGAGRRLDPGPFRLASYRGVRTATVHLGTIPCDFLAWEHLNWECATFDRGVHGETGLATSQPLHVAGQEKRLLLISTQRGRPRTARWEDLDGGRALELEYAVADELPGGGELEVRVDDRALATIELPPGPDGRVHRRTLPLPEGTGPTVDLELELRGSRAAVGVDGRFVE